MLAAQGHVPQAETVQVEPYKAAPPKPDPHDRKEAPLALPPRTDTVQVAPREPVPLARHQLQRGTDAPLVFAVVVLVIAVVVLGVWIYRLRRRLQARPSPERDFESSSVISPEQAEAGAQKGFETYGLLDRPDWRPLLYQRGAREPLLVQRLDATDIADAFYYLVPIGPSDHEVRAAARVDGISGEYLEASAFVASQQSWGSMIANWRTEAGTRQRVADRNKGGTLIADVRGIGVHPSFVWKPCVESQSPFYPFRLITIGDRYRYVRIDGEEFDSLTDLGPGTESESPHGSRRH